MFLSSLEVLLRQFKIKLQADLILVQLRKLNPKITRPLQSAREIYQSTETKDNDSESYSKTTAESNIQQLSRGLHPVGALSVPPLV